MTFAPSASVSTELLDSDSSGSMRAIGKGALCSNPVNRTRRRPCRIKFEVSSPRPTQARISPTPATSKKSSVVFHWLRCGLMRATENIRCSRKARDAAEFSHPHRGDRGGSALPVEKIEEPVELRGRVGAGGDFDDVSA